MINTSEINERPPLTIDSLAKEFLLSLPPEGILFHGTLNRSVNTLLTSGIKPQAPQKLIHFYSFVPPDYSKNDVSIAEIQELMKQFKNSLFANVCWAAINKSEYLDEPFDIQEEGDLPAVVVAKRPTGIMGNNEPPKNSSFNLPTFQQERAAYVPPEDILCVASLTIDEYKHVIQKGESLRAKGDMSSTGFGIARILQRKVLANLLARSNSMQNIPKIGV